MQDDNSTPYRKIPNAPVRHRRQVGWRDRGLVIGAVALVGLGGVAVATRDGQPTPSPVSLDAQAEAEAARIAAAARADRSARDLVAPSATNSPTPTPSASASPTAKPSPKATKSATSGWVIPMAGAAITSCYGPRWGTLHAGIDFALPAGTPVRAAFGGTVTKAGDVGDGYGISVVIDHGNGYLTHYAHLSTARVSVGEKVSTGQTIGLEGSTGDSTGPHLHFEVHQGQMWNQIDPAPFLRARGINVAC
ncbi:M23 family metallopeptidase [Micromonospora maris]|uniref:Peptidase M23 n=1 Tax=Micromonospora maris TaxID=1003110 RepID=A0A9X0I3W3_9ACTN|nr:peptidase M23B [Micromonospora maris AB-18-032]KUJ46310.1 peptidase M23 [Micromonospora maris]